MEMISASFSSPRADLKTSLQLIEQAELARPLAEPELAYLFKHALVQDTAYQSLLKNERKRLHRVIGASIEQTHQAHADEFAGELAHHFFNAGDDAKTFMYAQRAGDNAARVFAHPEASAYYERALDALTRLPDNSAQQRARVDVIVKLVAVSLRAQGPEWCLEKLRVAENLLRAPDEPQDRERLARVHFWMGDAYSHLNQQREAIAYLQHVLEIAHAGVQDETLLAIPSNVIGRALVAQGKFSQAEPLLAQAAPLLEKSANWYEWVLAVGFLGFARAAQGDVDAGLKETGRAFQRARELGTPTGIGDSHIFTSFIYHQHGDYDAALAHANDALVVARQLDDQLLIFLAHNARAWAQTRLGNFEAAEQNFARAQALAAQQGGQLFFADLFSAAYAELALCQGNMAEAHIRAERAIEIARSVGNVFSEGLARRVLAHTLARQDAAEQFELCIQLFEAGNAQNEIKRTREFMDASR